MHIYWETCSICNFKTINNKEIMFDRMFLFRILFLFWYQNACTKSCMDRNHKHEHFFSCSFLKLYWHENKKHMKVFRPVVAVCEYPNMRDLVSSFFFILLYDCSFAKTSSEISKKNLHMNSSLNFSVHSWIIQYYYKIILYDCL